MAFFTKEYFAFFKELEQNNHKIWFDENRKRYEESVKGPFKIFTQHIIDQLSKKDNTIFKDASKCIFRINKDIRFSKDKSPYKLNMAAVFGKGGTKDSRPGYYFHLGEKEIFVGGGMYMLDKEMLQKVRQEIFYNPKEFAKILAQKEFATLYGKVLGEANKILPTEYKEFAKEQPLIANKQFYCMTSLTKKEILSDDLDKIIIRYCEALKPLNDFLQRAIEN